MGKPIAGSLERVLATNGNPTNPPNPQVQPPVNAPNLSGYIYVPSINLYIAKERTLQGKNWFDAHKELQSQNQRMLIIPEFIEFLKYVKLE
jgi:hypothetical protein